MSSEILQKIENDLPADEIINWIKERTKKAHIERYGLPLEVGALNNAAGDWNEYMVTSALSEIAVDINADDRGLIVVIFPLPNSQISPVGSNQLSSKFLTLFKQTEFDNLGGLHRINDYKAVVSVKTQYRPDRRYQPLFEADLVKQLADVAGQNWKYYMVASKETSADTHLFDRIVTPYSYENHYNLVDGSFLFLRKADLIPLVEDALK